MGRRWHHRAGATSCCIKHIVIAAVDPRASFIQSVIKPLDSGATALAIFRRQAFRLNGDFSPVKDMLRIWRFTVYSVIPISVLTTDNRGECDANETR